MVRSGRIVSLLKRLPLAAAVFAFAALHAWAAEEHVVQGMLLKLDREHRSVLISCNTIPGFMDAMVMQFVVRQPNELKALEPGTTVRFTMVERNHEVYAQNLKPISGENVEAEPTEAARLDFLHRAVNPRATSREVPVGELVSDFTLFDQTQTPTRLTQFRGKVVVLSFTYSRCPNPGYCFRLSNNLAFLRKRFRDSLGRDLILMTIVIDPDNDRGKTLQDYVDIWKADPKAWRFLTGPLPEVRNVAELFGMSFWSDEGFLTHSFHTVVIDRGGRLAANLQGNQFAATQLGDLVQTVLRQDPPSASATGSNSRSN
jgi:protein SCO1/2